MNSKQHPITYQVKGMHCASCSANIERTFKKIDGVELAEVNYGTETAKVAFDTNKTTAEDLSKSIEPMGYSLVIPEPTHDMSAMEMGMSEDEHAAHMGLNQTKQEKLAEIAAMKWLVITLSPIAIFSALVMTWDALISLNVVPEMPEVLMEFVHHLLPILASYALFVGGKPYLRGLYSFFRYGQANMDTLVGLGTVVAFLYSFAVTAFEVPLAKYIDVSHNYYDVTIVVIAFITLGKYLESRAKLKTGAAIEELLNLQSKTALVLRNDKEVSIPITEVVHGDKIIVKPGERIAVDGTITEGSTFIDESMITGEPMPVEKNVGATVIAGTVNTSGSITFTATKVGSETMLASIIQMVREAQGSKAPIQGLADRISAVFVPVVLGIAVITFIIWLIVGIPTLGFSQALSYGLLSFISILVIACPCALGLATPTAIIVGVGKGAKNGILVKDAATLEKLHQVSVVVLDKTGTLTMGKPQLLNVHAAPGSDASEEEVLTVLASLEQKSEHPIGSAITGAAEERGLAIQPVENFLAVKGKGIQGEVKGIEYFAGNATFLRELGVPLDEAKIERATHEGKTVVLLATRKQLIGVALIADELKTEAVQAVKEMQALGIRVVMLTGDNTSSAEHIAAQAGITEVIAEVLPKDKLVKIKELQASGAIVAMAGDGVNDAPALAQADVGIAMSTGTDAAIESAGITILGGNITKLAQAIRLSKLTMRGIKQNLFWAFIYNIIGIPLAAGLLFPIFGWLLSPVFAGVAMAGSSVSVVLNSLRLKRMKL